MTRFSRNLGLIALAIVAGHPQLVAQDSTTGAVFGTVRNTRGEAISGARIVLDGGRGQVVLVSDSVGLFRATSLIPGSYTFTVSAPGYDSIPRQSFAVGVGQKSPLKITLHPTSSAVVEVVASSATKVDPTTVTSGTQFSSEVFASLPLGRSFTSIAAMAPGVVASGIDSANPSIGGGSGLENQYVIDGANTTNPGFGSSGAYSGTYGSLGTGINTDFIQEVQVKSFALEAEYGQTTGGVVNAITRSGTNDFEGSVFAYFDLDPLNAKNRVPNLDGVVPPNFDGYNRYELGFTAAGPIIKDKLFYFVGYNPIMEVTKKTAPEGYTLAGNQYKQEKVTNSFYGKVQWMINPQHLLEFSTFGDPGTRKHGPQSNNDFLGTEAKFSSLEFGSETYTLKYNGTFQDTWLVESRISTVSNTFKRKITEVGDSEWAFIDTANANAPLAPNAAGLYEKSLEGKNDQFDLKVTKLLGQFELKAGFLHESVTFDSTNQRSGPTGFVDPYTGEVFTTGLLVQQRYYVTTSGTNAENLANAIPYYRIYRGNTSPASVSTKTGYDAFFLQGSANLGRFNVKVGLRSEQQKIEGNDSSYTFKFKDNLSPRIGLTWDAMGNGKSKVYGFFGRYYEKVPLDIAVRAMSSEKGVNRADFYTQSGFTSLSDMISNGTEILDVNMATGVATSVTNHHSVTGSSPTQILPGTKAMYQDEFVLGYDHEFNNGIAISNRVIFRKLGRILEDLSLDGDSYFIGNPGQNESEIRNLTGYTDAATFPKPKREYWALEMEVKKATNKYNAFANVRFSKLYGNYEGLFRGDNEQDDPNISSLYDLPVEQMADPDRNLTGNEQFKSGRLPTDRPFVANFGFTYMFDMGLSLGTLGRVLTGTPMTAYLAHPVYENPGEIPYGGRGGLGRTPTIFTFDGTAAYTLKLTGKQSLSFRGDVFNLFNQQRATKYDTDVESGIGNGNPNFMKATRFTEGRRIRLGMKYSF